MSVFSATTRIPASAEALFDFHSDPRNLTIVMPPTLRLVRLQTDGPAVEGRIIELECRDFWIVPMRWVCRWRVVSRPGLLVDEMLSGPFSEFVHEHRFEDHAEGGCVMTDVVTYAWGRGWIGHMVSATAVRLYLTLLFAWRHHRTRQWAAGQTRPHPHPAMR
jgi:uncharacterized protein